MNYLNRVKVIRFQKITVKRKFYGNCARENFHNFLIANENSFVNVEMGNQRKQTFQVKVMLRVSDNQPEGEKSACYLSIDKKKRQVTLSEPTSAQTPQSSTSAQERGPMVSAPKMFAFDALHTNEDSQVIRHSHGSLLGA